jgi:hypothetical protein
MTSVRTHLGDSLAFSARERAWRELAEAILTAEFDERGELAATED